MSPLWPPPTTIGVERLATRPLRPRSRRHLHALAGLLEHRAERPGDPVELLLPGHERRRDLDDRVAAVVGAAEEPLLEQPRGHEPAQELVALLVA